MTDFLKETGLSEFSSGQSLKASDLNSLNNTINNLVKAVNSLLSNSCNFNQEKDTPDTIYTKTEVIENSPRRCLGLTIKYLSGENTYTSITYSGKDLEDSSWKDESNWIYCEDYDGGVWTID